MSVTPVINSLQGALAKGAGWYVDGDVAFTRTLTIGQILKARILRHYEGGRYLAEINGQQKVVDSTIPLRIGEVVHGRVTALDERAHMQRILHEPVRQQQQTTSQRPRLTTDGEWLEQLFAQHQLKLNPDVFGLLSRLAARVPKPHLIGLAGLVLSKLGTPITLDTLNAIYRALDTSRLRELVEKPHGSLQLEKTIAATQTGSEDTVHQLACLLADNRFDIWRRTTDKRRNEMSVSQDKSNQTQDKTATVNKDGVEQKNRDRRNTPLNEWLLGQRLLNTQSEGSVDHRLSHIPLWLGDRLVEISIALFSQHEASCSDQGIRYRRLVMSLETANLGQLEITVNLADRHLRLKMVSCNEAASEVLAHYFGELKSVLERHEWEIDEIKYITDSTVEDGAAVNAVVEHHIAQDSLSRLM
jgi:hypothetical protein